MLEERIAAPDLRGAHKLAAPHQDFTADGA